jgi:hypothetical protein
MSNPTEVELTFDKVKIIVEDGAVHLEIKALARFNTDTSTHWDIWARLTGTLASLRVKVEEPQSSGKRAFVQTIVREVFKEAEVRKEYSKARRAKLPEGIKICSEITYQEDWSISATIEYPAPSYTRCQSKEEEAEDA